MWPPKVQEQALAACVRRCCICLDFCGINMELHHIKQEADGGASTLDNCIPLCFKCHAEVGHYNVRHPKGTKFSEGELRRLRDDLFQAMAGAGRLLLAKNSSIPALPPEVYEHQILQFKGYVWRQTFPGRPNYEDLATDEHETYWMMVLPAAFRFNFASPEDGRMIPVAAVKVLHLMLTPDQYKIHTDKVGQEVLAVGTVWPRMTGHHKGDALLEVRDLEIAG